MAEARAADPGQSQPAELTSVHYQFDSCQDTGKKQTNKIRMVILKTIPPLNHFFQLMLLKK
jgi:hypothetical protein